MLLSVGLLAISLISLFYHWNKKMASGQEWPSNWLLLFLFFSFSFLSSQLSLWRDQKGNVPHSTLTAHTDSNLFSFFPFLFKEPLSQPGWPPWKDIVRLVSLLPLLLLLSYLQMKGADGRCSGLGSRRPPSGFKVLKSHFVLPALKGSKKLCLQQKRYKGISLRLYAVCWIEAHRTNSTWEHGKLDCGWMHIWY